MDPWSTWHVATRTSVSAVGMGSRGGAKALGCTICGGVQHGICGMLHNLLLLLLCCLTTHTWLPICFAFPMRRGLVGTCNGLHTQQSDVPSQEELKRWL